jgi:hypothetical protein
MRQALVGIIWRVNPHESLGHRFHPQDEYWSAGWNMPEFDTNDFSVGIAVDVRNAEIGEDLVSFQAGQGIRGTQSH